MAAIPVQARQSDILTLEEVLQSVEASYPPLEIARLDRLIADNKLLASQGTFDTSLNVKGETRPLGYYRNGWYDLYLEQPTTLWGINLFSGWRLGTGRFAAYEGKPETNSLGELRTGLEIPLLKDGFIDRRRTDISMAEVKITETELKINRKRIEVYQDAAQKYWKWVGAGHAYRVMSDILKIASDRDSGLEQSARLGQIPPVESLENKRVIFQRQSSLLSAERSLQQAANELSVYYRNGSDVPVIPSASQLPPISDIEIPVAPDIESDLKKALANNPGLKIIRTGIEQLNLELAYLNNQRLPEIDLALILSQDIGEGSETRHPFIFDAGLRLKAPLQMRTATGKINEAWAELSQMQASENFLKDQVTVAVKNAFFAITTALQQVKISEEELKLAVRLEEAEKQKFRLGDSNLLFINIREQATAEARIRKISALISYYQAQADYKAALSDL